MQIAEHYTITTEGQPALYAFRSARLLRKILTIFFGLMGFLLAGITTAIISIEAQISSGLVFTGIALGTLFLVFYLWPKRNIQFFANKEKDKVLWTVKEDWPFLPDLMKKFSIEVPEMQGLTISNCGQSSNWHPSWELSNPAGNVVIRAQVHSRSILRNSFGNRGFPTLDFVFMQPATGELIAEFNREHTVQDKYQLQIFSAGKDMDIRWILSMAIVLDTGLKR
ncbi:MAG: hypothetical protein AB7G93_23275 [Bdellovibrionales bacterium]